MSEKPICVPIHEAHHEAEASKDYEGFLKNHPQAYLAHAFTTRSSDGCGPWQIGYYDRASDRITVFEVQNGQVKMQPPSEVYKEPGRTIMKLDLAPVQFGVEEALHTIDARMKDAYKGELAAKEIVLLQTLPEWGTVWNITVLSMTFHVINFKMDARDGKILHESRESLTTMGKQDA